MAHRVDFGLGRGEAGPCAPSCPGPFLPCRAHRSGYQLVPQGPGPLLVCPLLRRVGAMGIPAPSLGTLSPGQAAKPREQSGVVGTPPPGLAILLQSRGACEIFLTLIKASMFSPPGLLL